MSWDGIKDYGFGSKNRTPEQDAEYRLKLKGVPKQRVWTKDRCNQELDELLTYLRKLLVEDAKLEKDNPRKEKQENIRDAITLMNKILEYMKILFPPTQTNVNVNIEMTSDAVIERLKNWKGQEIIEVIGNGK